MFFCCIFKCRVPRTKQEIEADFIRRQLANKFRRQLNVIKHSEMDEMDLLKGTWYAHAHAHAHAHKIELSLYSRSTFPFYLFIEVSKYTFRGFNIC